MENKQLSNLKYNILIQETLLVMPEYNTLIIGIRLGVFQLITDNCQIDATCIVGQGEEDASHRGQSQIITILNKQRVLESGLLAISKEGATIPP